MPIEPKKPLLSIIPQGKTPRKQEEGELKGRTVRKLESDATATPIAKEKFQEKLEIPERVLAQSNLKEVDTYDSLIESTLSQIAELSKFDWSREVAYKVLEAMKTFNEISQITPLLIGHSENQMQFLTHQDWIGHTAERWGGGKLTNELIEGMQKMQERLGGMHVSTKEDFKTLKKFTKNLLNVIDNYHLNLFDTNNTTRSSIERLLVSIDQMGVMLGIEIPPSTSGYYDEPWPYNYYSAKTYQETLDCIRDYFKSNKSKIFEIISRINNFTDKNLHLICAHKDNDLLYRQILETIPESMKHSVVNAVINRLLYASEEETQDLLFLLKNLQIDANSILKPLFDKAIKAIDSTDYAVVGQKIDYMGIGETFHALLSKAQEAGIKDLDRIPFNNSEPHRLEAFREILAVFPVSIEQFESAIFYGNLDYLQILLDRCSEEFITQNKEKILISILNAENPAVEKMFSEKFPQLVHECAFPLLSKAVLKGNVEFINWLLDSGRAITPKEAQTLLPLAFNSGNLTLIKLISQYASTRGHPVNFPEVLGLDKIEDPDKKREILLHFALFSPLPEIYQLVEQLPSYANTLNDLLDKLPLLVRFKKITYAQEIGFRSKSVNKYVTNSGKYAEENHQFIQKTLPKISQMTRSELLEAIVSNRFERNRSLDREYGMKVSQELTPKTPVKYPMGYADNRYFWCLRHMKPVFYDEKQQPHLSSPSMSMAPDEEGNVSLTYHYSFSDAEGEHSVPLTTMTSTFMQHSSKASVDALQEHCEKLHDEIIKYPLDRNDQENSKQFFEKVARGYWLTATLCEYKRGTPHNAMMWLNLIYAHHHLPPPIPKLEHFFLDNTMIVTPIDQVINDWHTYFEPPINY